MSKRYVGTAASLLITILIMIAIFMLSAQDSGESSSLSDSIARMLAGVLVFDFHDLSADEQMRIVEQWSWPIRKTAHATEFGLLALSWCVSCWQIGDLRQEGSGTATARAPRPVIVALVAFVITTAYACTDELHQLFIDGRAGQVVDVVVDASGALAACALFLLLACAHAHMKRGKGA